MFGERVSPVAVLGAGLIAAGVVAVAADKKAHGHGHGGSGGAEAEAVELVGAGERDDKLGMGVDRRGEAAAAGLVAWAGGGVAPPLPPLPPERPAPPLR